VSDRKPRIDFTDGCLVVKQSTFASGICPSGVTRPGTIAPCGSSV
jgi:hypothetical protein